MLNQKKPIIYATPKNNQEGNVYTIQYQINFKGIEGYGYLDFGVMPYNHILREVVPSLSNSDKVAEISHFIPHGDIQRKKIKSHLGYGVGTSLLELMTEHAIEQGSKLMYSESLRDDYQGFLLSKKFEDSRLPNPLFFKEL